MVSRHSVTTMSQTEKMPWYRPMAHGKTRIIFAWIVSAGLVFSAREYPTLPGIFICFLGASLRFWASGYLRKNERIAVGGPYGMTRNPLYLGTYLMAVGTTVAVQNWALLLFVTVTFAILYHYVILEEEVKLRSLFGPLFDRYCSYVPRFFPRLLPISKTRKDEINPHSEDRPFSWEIATRNKAHEAYAAFIAFVGFISLVAFAWQKWLIGSF